MQSVRTFHPPALKLIARKLVGALAVALALAVTISTAILAKERVATPPLVRVHTERTILSDLGSLAGAPAQAAVIPVVLATPAPSPTIESAAEPAVEREPAVVYPAGTRFFNGRPIRPARTITMVVTGYSPDHRSCGKYADGKTATLHSVWTNGMKLVAADTRVLPFGSMLTIPGYDAGNVVPVLDRGGAIKGNRLDLLFPTHQQARKWGVKRIPVTVWEYADGMPAPDPRKLR